MASRKPLPEIAPCPSGCMRVQVWQFGGQHLYQVRSCCGFHGPTRATPRGAILAWNRRRSDEAAERRGAMKALEWIEKSLAKMVAPHPVAMGVAACLREAIERGEVVGKRGRRG